MHFSIPDTQEVKSKNGGDTFVMYNIHLNGAFHCSVRYKQLHNLNEQLKKNYDSTNLPSFPSKKLLPLTSVQLEERRYQLEKYIQQVSQDNRIMSENLLRGFLLNAQMETQELDSKEVELDVFLMNGHKIPLRVLSTAHSDSVLDVIAQKENIPQELKYHFALFIVKKDDDSQICIVRKLQEFESPYMTLQTFPKSHRLVLRKGFWDSSYDEELLKENVCMNMLYVQTLCDLKQDWIITNKESQRQLNTLQTKGSKEEFVRLSRTLRYFGYIHFQPCIIDYPEPNTEALVAAGNRELNFRFKIDNAMKEGSFKVTRMKLWRITSIQEDNSNPEEISSDDKLKSELSFEYLISREKLQWITVKSPQAILMSICLQGMVEELLMKKNGQGSKYRRPRSAGIHRANWSYMKRDGSSHQISSAGGISNSTSSDTITQSNQDEGGIRNSKLLSKMKSFGSSSAESSLPKDFIENSAFEGIGDDDL